jgi:phosphoribosylanthranilate isomerase
LRARFWQAFSAGPDLAARMGGSAAEAFLIDTPAGAARGGTGRTFDWDLVRGLPGRIVLAGGLGPDNVAEAVRQVRPWGVDACSRLVSAPGRKDAAKVRALIQRVREAEVQ